MRFLNSCAKSRISVISDAVEAQFEDVPRDMKCYVDADGNTYDFAFGMNWSGVISDSRVAAYKAAPLLTPETIEFHTAN